ncbi:MAG: 1,2-phenylacetyl-CoA epoxidase subunit PaaD, partial [Sphingomonadales bacterium]
TPTTTHHRSDRERAVWAVLEGVPDPEIPVLSVVDLGIVRTVSFDAGNPEVSITPTYSGCPAMDVIEGDVLKALHTGGFPDATVKRVRAPAWSTDWISAEGRRKLEEYGIAPPAQGSTDKRALIGDTPAIRCPRCKSTDTRKVSEFGSTPCKAHYTCNDCLEPFDYFKCI